MAFWVLFFLLLLNYFFVLKIYALPYVAKEIVPKSVEFEGVPGDSFIILAFSICRILVARKEFHGINHKYSGVIMRKK